MPLPLGPPAQTPCLIYLCIYPLPPVPTQNLRTHPRFNIDRGGKEEGGKEGGNERWGGGEREGASEREGVTYAQWELTKHLVIKSKLTFW